MDKVMLQMCSQTSSGKKELKFVLRTLNRGQGSALGTALYAQRILCISRKQASMNCSIASNSGRK